MRSFLFLVFVLSIAVLSAHTAGDYRTKQSGNWTTADTWEIYDGSSWVNAGSAPNSSNGVITIRNGHAVGITTTSSTLNIDQTVVESGAVLSITMPYYINIDDGDGDDLTVNGTLNINGSLSNGGWGLHGSGKVVINGVCNWNSGHITCTDFNISPGGVMNMEGSGECRLNADGIINNAGTVNFAKTNVDFVMYNNGTFNNLEGGVFEATTNEPIRFRDDLGGSPKFDNAGTFRKTTGTGHTTIYRMKFNNTGTVLVESGTFRILTYTVGIHSGTFTIASGARIFSDDHCTHTFQDGTVINGQGEYETSNGDVNYVTGTTTGMIIDSDVTFKLSGNARLSDAGKLTINGTFDWTSTGNFNTGTIIVSQGANLNISGDNQKTYYSPSGANLMDNYGTITWSGAGNISGGGKTINNKNTGVFDIQNDASLISNPGSGAYYLINDGIVKKTAGSGTTAFISTQLTNNGTLQVDTGTLRSSSLTNYSHNSGNPILGGGIYDLTGIFRFSATYGVYIYNNNATIILNGVSSAILDHASGVNGMANLKQNTASGSLTLLNGRNFSTGAADFTNNGTLDCGTNVFSGSGNFTNASGGTLIIGSPDGITSSGSSGNIQSDGTRTFSTSGDYFYHGSSSQETGNGLPATVNKLHIENPAGVSLSNDLTITDELKLTEGDLDLNGKTVTLDSAAILIETGGNTLKGSNGTIQTTRVVNNPTAENIAGLGAILSSTSNLGSTTIVRGHAAQLINSSESVLRYYDILPTNNSGLNATFGLSYKESELNGIPENFLMMQRSPDGGMTWQPQGGLVDMQNDIVTLDGIDSFSRWTLTILVVDAPENVLINISNGNVQLSWNEVSNADYYKVYASPTPDGIFTDVTLEGQFGRNSQFRENNKLPDVNKDSGIEETSRSIITWIAPISGEMRFYQVKAGLD